MKNIVATIQRDQNAILRNEDAEVLIIQGVAGSGKTSIALHRIAFRLGLRGRLGDLDLYLTILVRRTADPLRKPRPLGRLSRQREAVGIVDGFADLVTMPPRA